LSERDLILDICKGWCHFYEVNLRQPYVALNAYGPWILTLHGAIIHDSGGYGMLGFGHNPDEVRDAMSSNRSNLMANIMTPHLAQKEFIDAMKKEIGHTRNGVCP